MADAVLIVCGCRVVFTKRTLAFRLGTIRPTIEADARDGTRGRFFEGRRMDSTLSFGTRNFSMVKLGHKRRTQRLVKVVDCMCRHPGGTLPNKLSQPANLRAFY